MKLRTLDLFHGAGGSSIGARTAGATIVAGVEKWDAATNAYQTNFPNASAINGDIFKISPKDVRKKIGNIDLIVASPECTNHSVAKGAMPRIEKSKETAFEVLRFVEEFMPEWVVIENVIQMKDWHGYSRLTDSLSALKYNINAHILDASNFGVAQSRKRLFLVCSRSKSITDIPVDSGKVPASSVIRESDGYKYSQLFSVSRASNTMDRALRAIDELGEKQPFIIVYYGTDGSGGWQPLSRPLRTITTIDRFAYVIPSSSGHKMRMLQPLELRKAMGFPDDYDLGSITRREKIKLLGNAVCPPVMSRIISTLK